MNKSENTICCPHCDYTNCLVEANFCGGCGIDLTQIKQQHYTQQQFNQQQFNQQQFNQHQFNQQQFNQQQFNQYQFNPQQFNPQQMQYQPYPPNYQMYVKTKKNPWLTALRVLLIISILIGGVILLALSLIEDNSKFINGIDESLFYNFFVQNKDAEPQTYYSAGGISSEEYDKLKIGMSYALTSSIIGGDGTLVNSGENIQNKFYYTYSWPSEIDESIMYFITFVDDAISEIMVDD